jgi:molecular chaperone HscB
VTAMAEDPVADAFARLGLPRRFDVDLDDLEERYLALSRVTHPDRFVGRPEAERSASLRHSAALNDAVSILRDPWKRADLLLLIVAGPAARKERGTPPGFVEEMLQIREAIAEARVAKDRSRLEALRAEIDQRRLTLLEPLPTLFDRLTAASPADRDAAAREIRLQLNAGSYVATLRREAEGD